MDFGSNRKYVLRFEFLNAKAKASSGYLLNKYGIENSPEFFQSSLNIQSELLSSLDEIKKEKTKLNYIPTGEREKIFIKRLYFAFNT